MKCVECGEELVGGVTRCVCGHEADDTGAGPAEGAEEASGFPPGTCRACGHSTVEPGYRLDLCEPCRSSLAGRPFPAWTRAAAVLVGLAVALSFLRFPGALRAAVAYERGQRAETAGDYSRAAAQYCETTKCFPGSTLAIARLAISRFRSGDRASAFSELQKLEGRSAPKDLVAEVDEVFRVADAEGSSNDAPAKGGTR